MREEGPIRVLLVADSPLLARLLAEELGRQAGICVVARTHDALQARDLILQHHPEVILLDVTRNDGLSLLGKLRACYPVPVIACVAPTARSGSQAMRAAAIGALDVLIRPPAAPGPTLRRFAQELGRQIRAAALEARPVPRHMVPASWDAPPFAKPGLNPAHYVVAVGASTGGTEAVRALLASAPPDFPPTVIVQHMPASFTASFAERLDRFSPMAVRQAAEGEALVPGRALVARGDTHLLVRRAGTGWYVHYGDQREINRHCPSVDVLFDSVAAAAGPAAVGVLLTGMGDDGARGLLRMHRRGAVTIAQDRDTCVVYGMPKVATELGAVDYAARPEEIPALIQRVLATRASKAVATHQPTRR